ncbi:glycosyl hydrolase family 71-domain-containing protein [Dichomitus squalens]|nr:glycosyl hydrolase family 71-domain-containing protein [Dichomitus squalens]
MLISASRRGPYQAGRPSLTTLLGASILVSLLGARGPVPVALAQTQSANDSVADQWLHELYSVFGIGPGGSTTPVSRSATETSAESASSVSGSSAITTTSVLANGTTESFTSTSGNLISTSGNLTLTTERPASTTESLSSTVSSQVPAQTQCSRAASGIIPNGTSSTNGTSVQDRAVFANFVVRNAETYTVDCWTEDIQLAASAGFDAFALSVGNGTGESQQVANAFEAVSSFNSNLTNSTSESAFKLFLSFNMTSLPCSSAQDALVLQEYIETYANATNYYRYNDSMLVSTFSGEDCTFGKGSVDDGWKFAFRSGNGSTIIPDVWFVPAFRGAADALSNTTVVDGAFNWDSAWSNATSFDGDQSYISHLGNRTYMAAVSLWSFTQNDGSNNATWCRAGWFFGDRWNTLVENRASVPLVQVVTWNEPLGDSYIGPSNLSTTHPLSPNTTEHSSRRRSLTRRGDTGQGILARIAPLMAYYIIGFKTGSYPSVTQDMIFPWTSLSPKSDNCSQACCDSEWIQGQLWAYALLPAPANVTLSCGASSNSTSSNSTSAPSGLSGIELSLPLDGCKIQVGITRNSTSSVNLTQHEELLGKKNVPGWALYEGNKSEGLTVIVPAM